jgi:hypothetical protein
MGVKCRIARNAPYISTIGVALAMVREQLERTVQNPTEADIKRIRADVLDQIVRSGAKEETVDVTIEIDAQKNILRAIATGATELRQKELGAGAASEDELRRIAAEALGAEENDITLGCRVGRWSLFDASIRKKAMLGIFKRTTRKAAVIDRDGVVHLRREDLRHIIFKKANRIRAFNPFLDENTTYSDANATIPKVFLFYKEKMLDLTGMQTAEQLYSIMDLETEMLGPEEEIIAAMYK